MVSEIKHHELCPAVVVPSGLAPCVCEGDRLFGVARSGEWPRVRAKHLQKHPRCAVCNGRDRLNVHHVLPVHLFPHLELEPLNLLTLCESGRGGINCHLAIGHLSDFHKYNPDVKRDAAKWAKKRVNAPG